MTNSLLSINGLRKAYSIPVLNGINIEISRGEVHALIGENGAGKSTLCNIIAGQVRADEGEIKFHNSVYQPTSIVDAESQGIRMITQELRLIDSLSVAENVYLTSFPQRAGFIEYKLINEHTETLLQRFGLKEIDPRQPLNSLGIGQQQLVEIARVLNHKCELLILDEPTAALSEEQVDMLFTEIKKVQKQGSAIIYVSHRIDEIARIANQTIVLRDGEVVASNHTAKLSEDHLIKMMSGHSPATSSNFKNRIRGPLALNVRNLSTREKIKDVSLDVYQGEIFGIGGLMGSGRTELLRAIFGADTRSNGVIKVGKNMRPIDIKSPLDAVKNKIGLINEDRKRQGLLPELSITQNITFASLARYANKIGWLDIAQVLINVEKLAKTLVLDCASYEQSINELSGGNQQKVIIARWLMMDCNILLFDEPTRGIDIQAKQVIYDLIEKLASLGKSVVIASSETNELFRICDRIMVLSNGRKVKTFKRGHWTPEAITSAAFANYNSQAASQRTVLGGNENNHNDKENI